MAVFNGAGADTGQHADLVGLSGGPLLVRFTVEAMRRLSILLRAVIALGALGFGCCRSMAPQPVEERAELASWACSQWRRSARGCISGT